MLLDFNQLIDFKITFSDVRKCVLTYVKLYLSQSSDYLSQRFTELKFNPESWIVLSSIEQNIKAKIEKAGIPLKDWDVNIYRGILTGFNEAFIINKETKDKLVASSSKNAEIIRPILLGKNIKRFTFEWDGYWIINAHNGIKSKGIPRINVEEEYPIIYEYLLKYKTELEKRLDQGDHWSNLRNCAYIEDFNKLKIGWGNLALKSQFSFIPGEYIINAPSPFFVTENYYLLAILNSKLGDYYIKQLGVSRSGGYFEYKPMFVEKLPIPAIKKEQEEKYRLLITQILNLKKNNKDTVSVEMELDKMIYELYGLLPEEIELLENIIKV